MLGHWRYHVPCDEEWHGARMRAQAVCLRCCCSFVWFHRHCLRVCQLAIEAAVESASSPTVARIMQLAAGVLGGESERAEAPRALITAADGEHLRRWLLLLLLTEWGAAPMPTAGGGAEAGDVVMAALDFTAGLQQLSAEFAGGARCFVASCLALSQRFR